MTSLLAEHLDQGGTGVSVRVLASHTGAMSHYPLFFAYRDRIFGLGFLAEVVSHGRILAAEEDGEHWVYGVDPGTVAATGDTLVDAFKAFRKAYKNVLIDCADTSRSFDDFEKAVRAVFHEVNASRETEWREAVEAVRSGEINLEGAPRVDADSICYIKAELKQQASFLPDDNYPEKTEPALAA